jgi:hypothetical protein
MATVQKGSEGFLLETEISEDVWSEAKKEYLLARKL